MKGWTVTTQAAASAIRREIYLTDTEHRNHIHRTEQIIPIHGSKQHSLNMVLAAESYKNKKILARRAGRNPSGEAIEFCLELPRGYRPTPTQWKAILADVMTQIANCCEIDRKALVGTTRAVLHRQKQDIERTDVGRRRFSGDHLHLLIGKFTLDGRYLRNLQRKTCTNVVKASFNDAVLKHCGFDWRQYAIEEGLEIQSQNATYYSKRRPSWQIKLAEQQLELETRKIELNRQAGNIELDRLTVQLDQESIDKLKNDFNKLLNQIEKRAIALAERNHKQVNRQTNRVIKSIKEIESNASFRADADAQATLQSIKQALDTRNTKQTNKPKPITYGNIHPSIHRS